MCQLVALHRISVLFPQTHAILLMIEMPEVRLMCDEKMFVMDILYQCKCVDVAVVSKPKLLFVFFHVLSVSLFDLYSNIIRNNYFDNANADEEADFFLLIM